MKEGREALEMRVKSQCYGLPLKVTARAKKEVYNGEARVNVTCVEAEPASLSERGHMMLDEIRLMLDQRG